jgi:hypothetical protein
MYNGYYYRDSEPRQRSYIEPSRPLYVRSPIDRTREKERNYSDFGHNRILASGTNAIQRNVSYSKYQKEEYSRYNAFETPAYISNKHSTRNLSNSRVNAGNTVITGSPYTKSRSTKSTDLGQSYSAHSLG